MNIVQNSTILNLMHNVVVFLYSSCIIMYFVFKLLETFNLYTFFMYSLLLKLWSTVDPIKLTLSSSVYFLRFYKQTQL